MTALRRPDEWRRRGDFPGRVWHMTYYVVGGDGQRYGPEEIPVLVRWAREGRLIHTTVLIETENGTRLTAAQLPELARELGAVKVNMVHPVPPGAFGGGPREMPGPKSKIAAGLLGIFLGGLGAH